MKKEIITPAPDNEVTELKQRNVLKTISIHPATGYVSFILETQQLDLKGNPMDMIHPQKKIDYHSTPTNTPQNVVLEEMPEVVKDYLQQVYDLTEALLSSGDLK